MELLLAWRYLTQKKESAKFVSLITTLSLVGIMLGVATLIVVLSVMNGFRDTLLDKVLKFNSHVTLYPLKDSFLEKGPLLGALQKDQTLKGIVPVVSGQAMASHQKNISGVLVRGMHISQLEQSSPISQHMIAGRIETLRHTPHGIIIGKRLSRKLGVKVGGSLSLMVPQGQQTPFGMMPRSRRMQVVGIFDVGMIDYNEGFAFVGLSAAQSLYNLKERVNAVEVFFKDPTKMRDNMEYLTPLLNPFPVYSVDWQKRNTTFFEAILVQRNVMFLVLTMIIMIAAFNIVSGLVMMVKDKTASIGMMRAMGMQRVQMMRVFMAVGLFIGIVGTLSGTLVGHIICWNIDAIRIWLERMMETELFSAELYYLSQLPVKIVGRDVLMVMCTSLGLTFLSTLYPAWTAARMQPVEALRHE